MSSSVHTSSPGAYLAVFAALLTLTAATVWVASFDLGVYNDVAAMGIAAIKATLVALIFMNVRFSTKMTKLTVIAGLMWLLIFFLLTFADYGTRGVFGVAGK